MTNSKTLKENEEIETYVLPEDAVIGGEWNLPKSYIAMYDAPEAPYWDIDEPAFNGYIKSVKETDDPDIMKVEYYIYRRNSAHCDGYYSHWSTGTAMVNIRTHRRWNVE